MRYKIVSSNANNSSNAGLAGFSSSGSLSNTLTNISFQIVINSGFINLASWQKMTYEKRELVACGEYSYKCTLYCNEESW